MSQEDNTFELFDSFCQVQPKQAPPVKQVLEDTPIA